MAGVLVVEAEPLVAVSDGHHATGVGAPRCRRGVAAFGGTQVRSVGGRERMTGQHVEQVHRHQLLMLLFVVQPQLDQRGHPVVDPGDQQLLEPVVDVRAVVADLRCAGPRQQAPFGSGVAGADRLVVRVEQVGELLGERPVPAQVRPEHERLEEPGRMGTVPLGGRHVGHRLHRLVLGRQRRRERLGERADLPDGPGAHPRVERVGHRAEQAHRRANQSAKSPSGSVQWCSGRGRGIVELVGELLGAELRRDLGAQILALGEADLEVELADHDVLVRQRPDAHLDERLVLVEAGDVLEPVGVEVRVGSRLMTANTLRLNAAVTPAASS